ncbi:MAG: OmpA family protein [Candidatus Poribacteria bacterium]|nr:OmpA family protein [Candidatus Poribacteria bacterium]
MQSKGILWLHIFIAILGGGIGCAEKIDPALLDMSLNDAQSFITDTRHLGAEEYAREMFANAVKLFEDSKQARQEGSSVQSLELAFQAQTEARVAGAVTRQKIAQKRLSQIREDMLKALAQELEYKVQTAQTLRTMAEGRERRAVFRAENAEQRMAIAQAEAGTARRDAKNARLNAQTQLAIGKAQLVLDSARAEGALNFDGDSFQAAENLINQALSLLVQEKFDEAKAAAVKAGEHAKDSRTAARVGTQAAGLMKLEDYADARVAIARAQIEIDKAESVNAFVHAQTLFNRAQTTLERANLALKTEEYKEALQLAAQAESVGHEAYTAAEAIDRAQSAKEAMEEKIAEAKDTIFKAEESIDQTRVTETPNLASKSYKKAVELIAQAKAALSNANYVRAITLGNQSLETLTNAIAKAKQIEAVETNILKSTKEISAADTKKMEKGVLVRFNGKIFETGSTEINPQYLPMLLKLAEILHSFAHFPVQVEAHSDDVGKTDINLKLTEDRATIFAKFLSEDGGVPSERISSIGLGEEFPIESNENKAGRDKNRRIDTIILTRE